jgi:putative membrane protein
MSIRLIAAIAAICLSTTGAFAESRTTHRSAHIAYTAGQIDIKAAQQALKKSKNRMFGNSQPVWSAIIRQ